MAILRTIQNIAVTGVSAKFTTAMKPQERHLFVCNTDGYFLVGATGGSVATTTGNVFKAGLAYTLECNDTEAQGFCHVISNGVSGRASLTLIED